MPHSGMGAILVQERGHSELPLWHDGFPSYRDGSPENPIRHTYNARITYPQLKEAPVETVNVTVRTERQTRDGAAKLFSELGMSTTQAINMFLKQAVRERKIPFEFTARPAAWRGIEKLG